MAVKDSVKTYCLYCKKILSDAKEIELQYHISCKTDIDKFENNNTSIEWQLAKALGLSESEIVEGLNKKEIKYVLYRNKNINRNKIKELEIRDLNINNKFNDIQLSPTLLSDLQVLSITAVIDFDPKMGWWKSDFKELPENIGVLKKLKTLNLSGNALKSLPASIGELTNLRILNLECNDLNELPNTVTKLVHLETLILSYNPLTTLPDHFEDLRNLKKLLLKDNKFDDTPMFYGITFPNNFGNLPKLEELRFYYELVSLPESFLNLKNLRLLEIHGRLRVLRHKETKFSVIDLSKLAKLKDLRLYACPFKPSYESYSFLKNLESLLITDDPDYFKDLKVFDVLPNSLVTLILQYNELKKLPTSITGLENLKFLDLRKNEIDTSIYEDENMFPFFKRCRTII